MAIDDKYEIINSIFFVKFGEKKGERSGCRSSEVVYVFD